MKFQEILKEPNLNLISAIIFGYWLVLFILIFIPLGFQYSTQTSVPTLGAIVVLFLLLLFEVG